MFVSIDCPDSYLVWLEERRKRLGLRSRSEAIREAIRVWAMVPEEQEPNIDELSKDWPRVDKTHICPACQAGEHCGGSQVDVPDPQAKTVQIWVCLCEVCQPKVKAVMDGRRAQLAPQADS